MWLYMFCIIVEDMNGWLTTEGGDGFKVEGESCGCKDLKDFNGDAVGEWLSIYPVL